MRIIFYKIAFALVLRLFSCAEMTSSTEQDSLTLANMPFDLMLKISSFTDNPFTSLGYLNKHFHNYFSTNITAKRIFQERFDLPELVTEEVNDNERELKFIISSFSKFKNSNHLYQALRYEFFQCNRFNNLAINIAKYFDRHGPLPVEYNLIKVLIKAKKFEYLYQIQPNWLENNEIFLFEDCDSDNLRNFQEYLATNPQRLDQVITTYGDSVFNTVWVKCAFAFSMPDTIIRAMPRFSSRIFWYPHLWTEIYFPKCNYQRAFENINFIIDNVTFEDEITKTKHTQKMYRLYSLIRYGPEDPNFFEEKIRYRFFTAEEKFFMCHCASLANKMDLFHKLLPQITSFIKKNPHKLVIESDEFTYYPLEMHKFVLDVHQNSDYEIRQLIYDKCNLTNTLSNYYRVLYLKWSENANRLVIDYKLADEVNSLGFLERITINRKWLDIRSTSKEGEAIVKGFLKRILTRISFDNAEALESLLLDLINEFKNQKSDHDNVAEDRNNSKPLSLFNRLFGDKPKPDSYDVLIFIDPEVKKGKDIEINTWNFKLLAESESIRNLIHQNIENLSICRKPFTISTDVLLNIDVEFDSSFADIAKLNMHDFTLTDFKNFDQFKRLEIITGSPVSKLLDHNCDYFEYRNFFKYIVESGQELPGNFSENYRDLMKADFPLHYF